MLIEKIRSKTRSYQRQIRIRNALEYIAALAVVVVFGKWLIDKRDQLTTVLMCASIIAATFFIVIYLRVNGYATTPPTGADTRTYLNYLIGDLTRQRNLVRNIFWWYLAPFIPGLALGIVDRLVHPPAHPKTSVGVWLAIYVPFLVVMFIGGYVWNQRAARRMQAGIDTARATLKSLDDLQR